MALDPTVPDGLVVAMYKGTRAFPEGIYNRMGRRIANGPYSHTELIMPDGARTSWSSSYMDGGVRPKQIGYSSVGSWDFLVLPRLFSAQRALGYFAAHKGWPYDLKGNFRFALTLFCPTDQKTALFCSEAVAESLGLPDAYKLDPVHLANLLLYLGARLVSVPSPQPRGTDV